MPTQSGTTPLLNATLRLAAAPAITVVRASGETEAVATVGEKNADGFAFELEATVPYEALNPVLDALLRGKQITLTEGLFRQQLVLEGGKIYAAQHTGLVAEVPFSGSFRGTSFITGTPVYNTATRTIDVQNVAYDLTTKSLVLKGAKWLFGNLILDEIKKSTRLELAPFYDAATARLTAFLNQPWATGLQASGSVDAIAITTIVAQRDGLIVRARCSGRLQLTIAEMALKF